MTSTQRSILGSILILISTLSLAFIFNRLTGGMGWLDFTSNQRYTLTDGTKGVLDKMPRPLVAKLFYSKTAVNSIGTDQLKRFIRAYYYARDLLQAYERTSGGKVKLEEFDPVQFSDEASMANELGIRLFPLTDNHSFALGLAVTSDTGAKEVLPIIGPAEESLLEYKITKLVERASRKTKKKVGVLSSLKMVGDNLSPEMRRLMEVQGRKSEESWNIVKWMQEDFEVEEVGADAKEVPDGLEYLVVVHPKGLPDETLYAIDQFVMRGGKLLLFVDPWCASDEPEGNPNNPYARFTHQRASDANRLTTAWGVTLETGKILGDPEISGTTRAGMRMLSYCMFRKSSGSFSEDEVITQSLDDQAQVVCVHAGNLKKVDGTKNEVSPLLMTTASGGTTLFGMEQAMRPDPRKLWEALEVAGKPLSAAVVIRGKLDSAFPDGLPGATNGDESKKDDKKPEHRKQSENETAVVVIGDVDMLSDQFVSDPGMIWGSPVSNRALVFNALEYLSGSAELIKVRSRGTGIRSFTLLEEIRKRAAKDTEEQEARIQAEIDGFQAELDKLNSDATAENVGELRGQALKKERETRLKIETKKKELNDIKRDSLREIEDIQDRAKWMNILGMPLLVALIGLVLWIIRLQRRSQQMREDMA